MNPAYFPEDVRPCEKPECDGNGSREYVGPNGNALHLCAKHYFEAVYPRGRVSEVRVHDRDERPPGLLGILRGAGE